ncbi:MAG TPA: DUF6340 family protein [Thermoanaerobaculia bacterium]|jgi:tetratricopeptide (TPR) repeat protein
MRVLSAVLLQLFLAPLVLALSPRIAFDRILPPEHDLGGAEEIALVQARGEPEQVEVFVDELLRDLNRSQTIRARDVRFSTGPADAHLDVKPLTCNTSVRAGEGSARDFEGNKVKKRYETVEAICTARIDVLNRFMKYRSTFYATGAATSPRADAVTEEERKAAVERAARHAASDAADRITPRRVRESIWLDQQAPAFEEGFAMIEASRLAEARKIWEEALRTGGRSAALRYNLGTVCEAMGDRRAAELHYNAARQLAPAEPRYTNEWKLFVRRGRP